MRPARTVSLALFLACFASPADLRCSAQADKPPAVPPPHQEPILPPPNPGAVKPLPLVPIPDDPPPHEGALFDLPYVIEPPDIMVVEVLEAFPGRRITGEYLVRPDGTINLGFYGVIHVRGLTLTQAKVKVVEHLRTYINDAVLGLLREEPVIQGNPVAPAAPEMPANGRAPGAKIPPPFPPGTSPLRFSMGRVRKASARQEPRAEGKAEPPPALHEPKPPTPAVTVIEIPGGSVSILIQARPPGKPEAAAGPPGEPAKPPAVDDTLPELPRGGIFGPPGLGAEEEYKPVPVAPGDVDRVFVDVTAYNSKFFYVVGEVVTPSKNPITGNETVFDAINWTGGFLPSADLKNIKLVRPARGGKPTKVYAIDYEAIVENGEARANLQLFPGDRLLIGRKPHEAAK